MKLLSIAVPCYNSEAYMRQCIESLLPGGEEVEILIVDDGSKDGTAAIADEYENRYPTICRAIHQENGGHGEAVNTGIWNATGLYFKVVDSDDHLSADAYRKVLDKIREAKAIKASDPEKYKFIIEIDGSCNRKTYGILQEAGVESFIVGTSGLFNNDPDLARAYEIMMEDFNRAVNP